MTSEAAKKAAKTRKTNAARAAAEEALRALNDLSPKAAREVMYAVLSAQTAKAGASAEEFDAKYGAGQPEGWNRAFWNLRGDVAGWLEQVDRAVSNTKFRVERARRAAEGK